MRFKREGKRNAKYAIIDVMMMLRFAAAVIAPLRRFTLWVIRPMLMTMLMRRGATRVSSFLAKVPSIFYSLEISAVRRQK